MKKNLLFYSGGLKIGGLEKILIEYVNNIDYNKYNVKLLLMSDFGDNTLVNEVNKNVEINYIKSRNIIEKKEALKKEKESILGKIKYNIFLLNEKLLTKKKLKKYFKNHNIDLLIDFDISLINFSNETKGIKKITWIQVSLSHFLNKESINVFEYGKKLKQYDKIVTVCEEMKEETVLLYPYLFDKITTIYNPFDFDRIIKKSNEWGSLNENDRKMIEEDYILSVARLDTRQKDFKTLIEAYKILEKLGVKEKLYIIGDGDGKHEVEELIKSFNLQNSVILLGAKQNPYIWMKNAQIFVHSSKYEGLPTVLIDAMILEKLVISSDCPVGPKEILENGESGILFETGNAEELSEKLIEVLKNEDIRKLKKERMVESVDRFRVEKSIQKLYSLLEKME